MLKNTKVYEYELPIKIEPQEGGGFLAFSPKWKDCYAQGDTVDEAVLEITAVAQSLIELYREEGMVIPLNLQSERTVGKEYFNLPILISYPHEV